jgi:hypothetical protein
VASPGFELLALAVPALVPPALRALYGTCSVRVHNRRVLDEVIRGGGPFVGVCWHKDFLFVLDYFRGCRIVVMVSRSRDGELVSRTLHRLGYRTVRGSSSAGGHEALRELVAHVRDGWGSAIVADGPRGPARSAKIGCVLAGRDTGAPLVTLGADAAPCWRLPNWDGTLIPRPFGRIAVALGEPILVPAASSREDCEAIRSRVDARMAELEATCRRSVEAC